MDDVEQKKEAKALLDFVVSEVDGLRVVDDESTARLVLAGLFRHFRSKPGEILERIMFNQFSDALFLELAEHYRNTMWWSDFRATALRLPRTYWGDQTFGEDRYRLSATIVARVFTSCEDVEVILQTRDILDNFLDAWHPFHEVRMDSDGYWRHRVGRFIGRDNRRAWDELGKAIRGIGSAPEPEDYQPVINLRRLPTIFPSDIFCASQRLVREMGRAIHEKMGGGVGLSTAGRADGDDLPTRSGIVNYLAERNTREDVTGRPQTWSDLTEDGAKLVELAIHFGGQRNNARRLRGVRKANG